MYRCDGAFREVAQVEQLTSGHDEVTPGQQPALQVATDAGRIGGDELHDQACGLIGHGRDDVAQREVGEDRATPEPHRHVPVGLELDQVEDRHEAVADGEAFHAGRQRARTPAPEVVDPVVAVGRHLELAEPAEDDGGRGVHRDAAPVGIVGAVQHAVAGIRPRALLGRRTPGARDLE
jgi:hypothetical protein